MKEKNELKSMNNFEELTDDQLDSISGGKSFSYYTQKLAEINNTYRNDIPELERQTNALESELMHDPSLSQEEITSYLMAMALRAR